VTANGASLGGSTYYNDFVSVQLMFCVGSSTFDCTVSSPNYGMVSYYLSGIANGTPRDYFCFNNGIPNGACSEALYPVGSSDTASIDFTSFSTTPMGVQNIAFQSVDYATSGDGSTVSLESYADSFYLTNVVPEPPSLLLLGTALAALAVLLQGTRSESCR
jgi:hypothetical protein